MQSLRFFAAALVLLALAACKPTETQQTTAQVRVLHASPDTEALMLKVSGGDTKLASVATGTASGYFTLDAASTAYEIHSVTDNTLLLSRTTALVGGGRYTLYVNGRRNALTAGFVDEDTLSPSSGKFRFRLDNVSNVGAVDLYLVAQTSDVPAATASFTNAAVGVSTVYTEVAEGDYQMVLTTTGTKDIVFESAKQHFAATSSYTFAVTAGKSAKLANITLLTYGSSGTATAVANLRSRVRAVHASPDASMLAFNNNGQNMFSNVPYKANSSYTNSTAGDRTMSLSALDGTGATLVSKTLNLTGGEDYTLVATGNLAAIDLVKLDDNNLPPITGKVRVRFANLSPDAGTVDLLVNFSKTLTGVAFKGASAYVELDVGTYTFGFSSSSTSAGIASTAATLLETGKIYTVLLLGPVAAIDTKIITDN